LNRYFDDYVARGYLSAPRHRAVLDRQHSAGESWQSAEHFEVLLRPYFGDSTLQVTSVVLIERGSDHSVVGELTSWRRGRPVGLFRYRIGLQIGDGNRTLDVMVKVKPSDEDVLQVAETTAATCDGRVSAALRDVRDLIGVRGSHLREPALYGETDERIRRHQPRCYGTWRNDGEASWGIVLERLTDMAVMDAADSLEPWTDEAIQTVIKGLAEIHSVWLGREVALRQQSWIGHLATSESAARLQPFWRALADHAAPRFQEWAGPQLVRAHDLLVSAAPLWWRTLDAHPKTLIHHDFNPRNIGLRREADRLSLVAYDWELATIGVPQRDLAELLCFVLPEDVSSACLNGYVEMHRHTLEQMSGASLDRRRWWGGFVSALSDVLVARFSFYALIDRVRPQPFLPRVTRTWLRLHELCGR
jgi:hydroxymethylglutaryl-CoA reductase (NADPH)